MSSRKNISSGSPYEPRFGFSRAVRVGDRVLVAGTGPIWPDGSCSDDPAVQTRPCIEIMEEALIEAGASLNDVVRTRMFVVDAADGEAVGAVHGEFFSEVRPAATMVLAGGLLDPRWRIEMEAEALIAPQ
ncbi:MAG: enamine deaminase RidA (YjgF/YER057c/UK114 family) [Planctomycetota bacterium]|jgi:enamine deaminase RidA (YjgF/YER057c/UK114 family)